MSWSDDIRCLYCDGKLPLYRKITHGQFCSSAHRRAYWQEQERLAVERLHQTHSALQVYRPAIPIEQILGPSEEVAPGLCELVSVGQPPPSSCSARLIFSSLTPYFPEPAPTYELALAHEALLGFFEDGNLPGTAADDPLEEFEFTLAAFVNCLGILTPSRGSWHPRPAESIAVRTLPPMRPELACGIPAQVRSAGGVPVLLLSSECPSPCRGEDLVKPAPALIPRPILSLGDQAPPSGSLELPPGYEEEAPRPQSLLALARFAAQSIPAVLHDGINALAAIAVLPVLPSRNGQTQVSGGHIGLPGLQSFALRAASGIVPSARLSAPEPLAARISQTPEFNLSTPLFLPGLRMAKGSRYPVRYRTCPHSQAEPQAMERQTQGKPVIPREFIVLPVREQPQSERIPETNLAGPVRIPLQARAGQRRIAIYTSAQIPQPLDPAAILPRCRWEPLEPPPAGIEIDAVLLGAEPGQASVSASPEPARAPVWKHAAGFWKHAPRDLKLLVFAIPGLLALAFHPPLPKIHLAAHSGPGIGQHVQTEFKTELASVRQAVVQRAAVALQDDFRQGLDDWASPGNAPTTWSFDATGFVRPASLALYRPSMGLSDYQMQFLGIIDKKALSWVVRAADFQNYYVVKLEVVKPGPVPVLGITRYAVIHGQAQERVDTPVQTPVQSDAIYQVGLDVHGDMFALSVQGHLVDDWSEPRLRRGGIGFFNARGEESRLRWVQVTHQYDMLGRLCAYLAPYNFSTNGGSQP